MIVFNRIFLPWLLGNPAVIYWWRHWGGNSVGADVPYEDQGLFQSMIHPQHLIPPLSLLCRLLHQTALVPSHIQVSHQLRVDEILRLERGEETGEERGLIQLRYTDPRYRYMTLQPIFLLAYVSRFI